VMQRTLQVTPLLVTEAMDMEGIDEHGFMDVDWRYMTTLFDNFSGGPAGCVAIAATMQVNPSTLAEKVEPYLLRMGHVLRTPGGRVLSQPMRALVLARKAKVAAGGA
jgi:Holliday junction DNA helicase RuvB